MALKQNPGFMAALGMDVDPEQIRIEALKDAQQKSLGMIDQIGYKFASERAAATTGALLGSALMNRKPRLTPEQQALYEGQEAVKQKMESWRKANPEATTAEVQDKYLETIANEAMSRGLTDIGFQSMSALEQQRKAREKQDLELAKLRRDERMGGALEKSTIAAELLKNGKEGMVTVYPVGSNNPNSSRTGWMDENGNVTFGDGEVLPAGSWTDQRPMAPSQMRTKGSGGSSDLDVNRSEAGELRKEVTNAVNTFDTYIEIDNLLTEAAAEGITGVIGDVGRAQGWANRWITFGEEAWKQLTPGGELGSIEVIGEASTPWGKPKVYDQSSRKDRWRFAQDNKDKILAEIEATPGLDPELRKKLRAGGTYADRFLALATDLTYGQARANEGGGGQRLSDQDYIKAVAQTGANINNPEELRKVLRQNATQMWLKIDNRLSMYDEDKVRAMISDRGMERLLSRWADVSTRLGGGEEEVPAPQPPNVQRWETDPETGKPRRVQ